MDIQKEPTEEGIRDAIHVPVVSMRVAQANKLAAGSTVYVRNGFAHAQGLTEEIIGVANPFMLGTVTSGELVWVILKPGSVPHVNHTWDHPLLDKVKEPQGITKDEMRAMIKELIAESNSEESDPCSGYY